MPSITVKLTDPTGTYTDWFHAVSFNLPPAESFVAQTFTADLKMMSRHEAEDSTGNTTAVNSLAYVYWGTQQVFFGRLFSATRGNDEARRTLSITANSILSDLGNAAAGKDTERRFEASTPIETRTEITLRAGQAEGESDYPYYPDAASGCYLPISGTGETPHTTVHQDTAHGSSTMICEGTPNNMAPKGYAAIDGNTWFWYDGYQVNPDHDDLFTMYGLVWDVLGASGGADPVPAGTAIHQAIPRQVAGSTTPKVEGKVSAGPDVWEVLAPGYYKVREHEGRIDLIGDPTAAPFSYLGLRMTYDTVEEDDAARYLLADFVSDVLEFSEEGGLGLSAADYDVSGIDAIPLRRVYLPNSVTALQAIQSAVSEMELDRYNAAERICFYYDAPNGKFMLENLTQADTPDFIIKRAVQVVESISLAGLASHVIVSHERPNPSLISPTRMWHPEVGRTLGASTVNKLYWQYQDRELAAGWQNDTTAGNKVRTQLVMDGNDATGIGIGTSGSAGGAGWMYPLYSWFRESGGVPLSDVVNHARLVVDLRRAIPADLTVELVGITSYTPGTPPTVSGIVKLSDYLSFTLGSGKGIRGHPVDRVAHGGQFKKGYWPARGRWL